MREREVEEHHVAGLEELVLHLVALPHHLVVVAVTDHAGLRRAGCARRVDEREQVVLVDRVGTRVEVAGMIRRPFTSARAELVQRGERDDVAAEPFDLRELLVVLDQDAAGFGVLEDVLHVACGARRVDRRANGADQSQREVEQRPLERRAPEEGERISPGNAQREEAVGELVHHPGRVVAGDLVPFAAGPRRGRPGRGGRLRPRSATGWRSCAFRPRRVRT